MPAGGGGGDAGITRRLSTAYPADYRLLDLRLHLGFLIIAGPPTPAAVMGLKQQGPTGVPRGLCLLFTDQYSSQDLISTESGERVVKAVMNAEARRALVSRGMLRSMAARRIL